MLRRRARFPKNLLDAEQPDGTRALVCVGHDFKG